MNSLYEDATMKSLILICVRAIQHLTIWVGIGHVLITTYSGTRINQDMLCEVDWEYAILDEGDKIRNADADVTLTCKRLKVSSLPRASLQLSHSVIPSA